MCKTIKSPTVISLDVLKVLTDLDREEHSSNGRMGLLGKRVTTKKMEKIIGVKSVTETEDVYNESGTCIGEVAFVTQSDPFVLGKEPTSYKRGKEPNRYKVRNEGY